MGRPTEINSQEDAIRFFKTHNYYHLRFEKKPDIFTITEKNAEELELAKAATVLLGGEIDKVDDTTITIVHAGEFARKLAEHGVSFVGVRGFQKEIWAKT